MRNAFITSDNIISSLGFTTRENMDKLKKNITGFGVPTDDRLTPTPVPVSLADTQRLESLFETFLAGTRPDLRNTAFTRLEKMLILSVNDAIKDCKADLYGKNTIFILSTTKGNIDLLEESNKERFDKKRVYLWELAGVIRSVFGFGNRPVVVSNACISGVLAIGTAYRFLRSGLYDHAVVSGGDILSKFVVSGFQSFQSLSSEPCRPYDISRNGLSLGEACGTVVMTSDPTFIEARKIRVEGMATSNDANHISGPSRTGEELALAVVKSMKEAHLSANDIGFISAHGTATPFNDEMESKAFSIAGLKNVPLNSFKGYWGHTLGAAGMIESVAAIHSMKEGLLIKSAGYSTPGVPEEINVISENAEVPYDHLVKTASGFGGCNAAIIFGRS